MIDAIVYQTVGPLFMVCWNLLAYIHNSFVPIYVLLLRSIGLTAVKESIHY